MKNYSIQLLCIIALLTIACGEDYLIKQPSEELSKEQIDAATKLDPDIQAGAIAGNYTNMYRMFSGGTGSQEDFGQKSYDIYSDLLSADMALQGDNYGWYSDVSKMIPTTDYTYTQNYMLWRYYYRIIRSANETIDALGGTKAEPKTEKDSIYMGQAKAMRAYAYFYLANFMSNSYQPDKAILPIYTNTTDPNQPLSKTSEVYTLIVTDLKQAIGYLKDFQRTAKHQINKYVAEGLLAYVYATMEKWKDVLTLTTDVIQNGGFTLMTSAEVLGGFNDIATPGWMWGVDLTTEIGLSIISWWGHVDYYTYGYASSGDAKVIDKGLYDKIKPTDVRKKQFLSKYLLPIGKIYDPNKVWDGQRTITTDYVYMRVAEMYLLKAEAAAHLGDAALAKATLKELLSKRFDNPADYAYVDTLPLDKLLAEIYLQTRIELWGEGKSYLAMKRNKATVTRGSNHLSNVGESIRYDDARLTFEIPQSEIQNNPHINKQ